MFGDALSGQPERLTGDDLLAFAGRAPVQVVAISKTQQFAEKAHAYTLPWADRENTRVKDLVDLLLLVERGALDRREVLGWYRNAAAFCTPSTFNLTNGLSITWVP